MPDAHALGFYALAVLLVGSAVAMLSARNIVHAAYWLLGISIGAAGLFALLEASYVALMQLLIYAGAVAILNIFTIMITMRRREDAVRPRDFSWPGLLLAAAFFGLVAFAIVASPVQPAASLDIYPGVVKFGEILFSADGWALPFEIASLVLTAALIAAVWWSKEGEER